MSARRASILWQVLWLAALALGLAAGLLPAHTMPDGVQVNDLVAHAVACFLLGALAYLAFGYRRAFFWALAGLVLYGGAIEVLQAFVPNRYPSLADFVADALGVALAGGAAAWLERR